MMDMRSLGSKRGRSGSAQPTVAWLCSCSESASVLQTASHGAISPKGGAADAKLAEPKATAARVPSKTPVTEPLPLAGPGQSPVPSQAKCPERCDLLHARGLQRRRPRPPPWAGNLEAGAGSRSFFSFSSFSSFSCSFGKVAAITGAGRTGKGPVRGSQRRLSCRARASSTKRADAASPRRGLRSASCG